MEQGESRWSALRRQYRTLQTEHNTVLEILRFLQSGPETEALETYHRMRNNPRESWSNILQFARDRGSTPVLPRHSAPTVGEEVRLPPISAMIEASEAMEAMSRAPHMPRRMSIASEGSRTSNASHVSMNSATSPYSPHAQNIP